MDRTPKCKPPLKEKCKSIPKHPQQQRSDNSDSDGETKSGGKSHKNMHLNLWDENAMIDALAEYNQLCRIHGSETVSTSSVAESHSIPPPTFWKRY